MKKGVITDCFKKSLRESIICAAELGFDGVQIYATSGEFSPEILTDNMKKSYNDTLTLGLLGADSTHACLKNNNNYDIESLRD